MQARRGATARDGAAAARGRRTLVVIGWNYRTPDALSDFTDVLAVLPGGSLLLAPAVPAASAFMTLAYVAGVIALSLAVTDDMNAGASRGLGLWSSAWEQHDRA